MQLNLQTRYITLDEFRQYTGIDLIAKFGNSDDTAESFLNRVVIRMETFIDANYFKNVKAMYPNFTDEQKAHYKYALLEQALYIFKNGDISVDSGYDPEHGIIASKGQLQELSLCNNAKEHLIICGLLTRKIQTRRAKGFLPFWR